MTDVPVCVGPHFRAVAGVLDIQAYAGRRLLKTTTTAASNDGTFTAQSVLPGLNHLNVTDSWTNSTGTRQRVRVELLPGSRLIRTSQPNLTFFRHRATVDVGASPSAADPALGEAFDSEMGGGFDLHGEEGATPAAGIYHLAQAVMPHVVEDVPVEAGETIQVRYRCAHYSPDPFATNANNNSAQYTATARNVTIQFWGWPEGV